MRPHEAGLRLLIGTALLVAGCTASPEPTPIAMPTENPAPAAGNLPPGCGQIDLRTPDGEGVNLDGTWFQEDATNNAPATWWVRQLGDCVWAAGIISDFPAELHPLETDLQVFRGHMSADFVIEGEILALGSTRFATNPFAPIRLFIEFDENSQITLREDREYGVEGPRCPGLGNCLNPMVLRRTD